MCAAIYVLDPHVIVLSRQNWVTLGKGMKAGLARDTYQKNVPINHHQVKESIAAALSLKKLLLNFPFIGAFWGGSSFYQDYRRPCLKGYHQVGSDHNCESHKSSCGP